MSFNPFAPEPDPVVGLPNQYYQQPASVNPFLADVLPTAYSTQSQAEINPFLSYTAAPVAPVSTATNPFASFAEPIPATTAPLYVTTNQWGMPQDSYNPIHQTSTVPDYTQNLLQSVTGALEATSDSLSRIGQPSPIPPFSTPSPRSPSPDLLGLGDDDMHVQPMAPTSQFGTSTQQPPPFAPQTKPLDILSLYSQSIPTSVVQQPPTNVGFDLITGLEDVDFAPMSNNVEPLQAPPTQQLPKEEEEVKCEIAEVRKPVETVVEKPKPIEIVEEVRKPLEIVEEIRKTVEPPEETIPDQRIEVSHEITPPPVPLQPVPSPKAKPPERPKPPPVPPAPIKKEPPPARPAPPPVPVQAPLSQPISPVFEPPEEIVPEQPSYIPPVVARPEPPPVPPIVPKFEPPVVAPAPFPSPAPVTSPFQPVVSAPAPPVFGRQPPPVVPRSPFQEEIKPKPAADFDSFEDRFNQLDNVPAVTIKQDAFGGGAWGDEGSIPLQLDTGGFGNEDQFDSFLSLTEPPPVPQSTPAKGKFEDDDGERTGISVKIRAKENRSNELSLDIAPVLAPPPKSPAISTGSAFSEDNNGFVPFLSSVKETKDLGHTRSDSQDSPQTPLFEEDTTQPLEDFPRIKYTCDGWEMHMRHPNKKKITGQRFWKKVYVRLTNVNDIPTVQISNTSKDKDPFQEIPLQACYSVSDVAAQQFDQFGKIFTVKLQYIFYKERPGVRPGQISKAEKLTNRLTQFAAYAIQGDYQGVKEFGSDLKKLGLPLEHAPQVSQLVKLGTQNYEEMKQFSVLIEEALFRLPIHRDRSLQYKSEEVQVTLVDEYYIEQDIYGVVTRQIARVRLHLLSFLSGEAEIELGINDIRRQGLEVVGRHDIIPIATEEWIRIEDIEFASCVKLDVFEKTKMVKFKPPDACYIELLRFRVRPPRHRELPMQVKTVFTTTGSRVDIRCDILVPGFTSRKLGQIPCEDVMVRIPIPECWIYMFRVEKHFRYGSVKSAHRRSGKVKGIERFLGAVEAVEQSLMEVTSGQAKYEHQHKSIVWRVARLPKEGQGAYTTHSFFCHITLQPHEEMPSNLTKHCYVEFTMPHTTISHTVCRSISVPHCDEPPEKCVKYLSRHEYTVEVEHSQGIAPGTYNLAATVVTKAPEPEPVIAEQTIPEGPQSDSDFSE